MNPLPSIEDQVQCICIFEVRGYELVLAFNAIVSTPEKGKHYITSLN